jgi:hypothetical protein
VAHHGWDRTGRPIYWEKTGTIQNNFTQVFKHFTTNELVQYHIMSQECFELRFEYATKKMGIPITNSVVVFDMTNVNMALNIHSIAYIKQILTIDQLYYPETLHKLFIINCPWYFTALYGLFKPFIDQRTKDKFTLLGSDFLSSLLEVIDISEIPEDFGGESADVCWDLQYQDSSGCSEQQIIAHMRSKYTDDTAPELLSEEEVSALYAARCHPDARGEEAVAAELREGSYDADGDGQDESEVDQRQAQAQPQQQQHRRQHSGTRRFVESLSVDGTAVVSSDPDPRHQRHHAHIALRPTRTRMVKAEDASRYHLYYLVVEYGDSASWPIRRRYSDFHKFNEKLKIIGHAYPNIVWPKLPPKTFFFKRSKSVVALRLVGLDFFLSAVLDRMLRIETDGCGDAIGAHTTEQGIALRQNLRIAILEFLEVTDHVTTVAEEPLHRDILIRQLQGVDSGARGGAHNFNINGGSHNSSSHIRDSMDVGRATAWAAVVAGAGEGAGEGDNQEQTGEPGGLLSMHTHLIALAIAVLSGIIGYYIRMMYYSER